MKLSVTILAGAYSASKLDVMRGYPIFEQPGDLVVTVSGEELRGNAPVRQLLGEMLQEAEASIVRMTRPLTYTTKEIPSDQ